MNCLSHFKSLLILSTFTVFGLVLFPRLNFPFDLLFPTFLDVFSFLYRDGREAMARGDK